MHGKRETGNQMHKRSITAAATAFALAGLWIGIMPSSAATTHINFDDYTLGSVNGQQGWTSPGAYDQAIVAAGKAPATMSVSINPVCTEFTRIPSGAHSSAAALVNIKTPPFEAQ